VKSDKPVPVTGVWLRSTHTEKDTNKGLYVEILVEVDGAWRNLGRELVAGGVLSHIWEPPGILKAPVDEL